MSDAQQQQGSDAGENVGLSIAATTAAAPTTKRGQNRKNERTDAEAVPPSSSAWAAPVPADPEPDRVVPMTAQDEAHMREELGRDPAELAAKQQENAARLAARRGELEQAAPGQNLDEVAAADAVGIAPAAAAAAAPRPTAETIDSNRLGSDEGKTAEVFVRKETGT